MGRDISRRSWMGFTPAALGVGLMAGSSAVASRGEAEPFGYCLNTSTLQGQKLTMEKLVDVTAEAGYRGIEPWIRDLDRFVQEGGSLRDLGRRIADRGLSVEGAI